MRVVNHTMYQTKQLRALAMHVAEQELDPAQRKFITIHFHYRSQKGNRKDRQGRRIERKIGAGLRYNSFCVSIKKDPRTITKIHRAWLGVQLAHEMAECRGRRHKEMRHPRYGYRGRTGLPYGHPWGDQLEKYPLELRPKKEVATVDQMRAKQKVLAKKLLQAQQRIMDWERKARLAQTKVRTWRATALRVGRRLDAVKETAVAEVATRRNALVEVSRRQIELDD